MFRESPLRFCARCDEPVYEAEGGHRLDLEQGPDVRCDYCSECFRRMTLGYTDDPAGFALLRRWGARTGLSVWREGDALCLLRKNNSERAAVVTVASGARRQT